MKVYTALSFVLFSALPANAQRVVHAGDSLQTALTLAQPGETITLDAGAVFTGNFVLPVKTGTAPITVQSSAAQSPARAVPEDEALMPVLRSPNATQALRTAPGAAHWRLVGLVITAASTSDVVQFGDGSSDDPATLPRDIQVVHCIVRTDTLEGTSKNGIVINGADITIRNSRIAGIKLPGTESHAIVGWAGPGPFTIENNYIEAGSIGLLIGGAKAAIPNTVPSDIVIRWNTFSRPVAWKNENYGTKNQLELKNARRVTITGNLIENNWPQGQAGFAVVFTVRANSDTAPWSTIEDVLFENNIVRHTAQAFNILGHDSPQASQTMDGLTIRNNLIYDVDRWVWGGSGALMNIDGGPMNLHIEQNTMLGNGSIMNLGGTPMPGFVFRGNIVQKVTSINPATGALVESFGVFGNSIGEGSAALNTYTQADRVFTGNVLAGATPATYSAYPGNLFPSSLVLTSAFRDVSVADYRLEDDSAFEGLGMDQDAIAKAMQVSPLLTPRGVWVYP